MATGTKLGLAVLALFVFSSPSPLFAQQKGQWLPGQAGILPDPGFTYQNMTINYSSDTLISESHPNPAGCAERNPL